MFEFEFFPTSETIYGQFGISEERCQELSNKMAYNVEEKLVADKKVNTIEILHNIGKECKTLSEFAMCGLIVDKITEVVLEERQPKKPNITVISIG